MTTSFLSVDSFIASQWKNQTLQALKAFISLPSKSPAFDSDWEKNGYLERAAQEAARFGQALFPEGQFLVKTESGKTPCLFFSIPGSEQRKSAPSVLFYGHLDKQPEAEGWTNGRTPFVPSEEGNCLYGRGAVDDGYSVYCALTSVAALKKAGLNYPPVYGVIETCEESGSYDLAYWLQKLSPSIHSVGLIVALDSAASDYSRLWISTTFRGLLSATVKVTIMEHGVHSGTASGAVPESFTIARALLDRLEDSSTGTLRDKSFYAEIPPARLEQLKATAQILDANYAHAFPLVGQTQMKGKTTFENMINTAWSSQLALIGIDGVPPIAAAGNVLRAQTSLRLSIRIPAHINVQAAVDAFKKAFLTDVPYGARVEIEDLSVFEAWDAPAEKEWFLNSVNAISMELFGNPVAYIAEGGSIPILSLFARSFPQAQFFVTGALGPQSNAHGPNEMLRLDYVEKLTEALARLLQTMP